MGALADLDLDDADAAVTGTGKRLVEWWNAADDDDRAAFRAWVDAGLSRRVLAERLTAAGFPISLHTVSFGLRLLRRLPEWAS